MGKNIRIVLLFVLVGFNIGSFANKFKVDSFTPDDKDLEAQIFERMDNSNHPCAIIKVTTDIEGLSFESNNGIVGDVVVYPGEYWVYVSPGEKSLRIIKNGFTPIEVICSEFNIKIESSSVYKMKLHSEIAEVSLVETKKQVGDLRISTIPSQANITIEGEPDFKNVTPYFFEQRSAKPIKITLQKDYFDTKDTIVWIIPDSLINLTLKLTPNVGLLFFSVNPPLPKAIITFDNKVITGINEQGIYPVSKGPHEIYIESKNWYPEVRKVESIIGKTDSLFVNLKPIMGKLNVNVTPAKIKNAEIWINDKKTEYFAPAEFPLQTGNYTLSLKKEGYPPSNKLFTIKENEKLNLKLSMLSLEALRVQVKSHQRKQNIWMASAIVFGAAGEYLAMESKNKYQEYQTATGSNANSLRTTITLYQKYAPVAFGIAAFSAIEFSFQLFKKSKDKHWLNLETNGQQARLTANF